MRVLAVLLAVLGAGAAMSSAEVRKPNPGKETVVQGEPKLPAGDLTIVTPVTYLAFPCALEGKYTKLDLDVTVKNAGPGPAYASHGIEVRAYPARKLLVDKLKYAISVEPLSYGPKQLDPGKTFIARLGITIGPAVDNKPFDVVVEVDRPNVVKEANEGNNTAVALNVPAVVAQCTAVGK